MIFCLGFSGFVRLTQTLGTGHLGPALKGLCYGCLVHFVNNVNKEKSLSHLRNLYAYFASDLAMVAKCLVLNNCGPAVVEKKKKIDTCDFPVRDCTQ